MALPVPIIECPTTRICLVCPELLFSSLLEQMSCCSSATTELFYTHQETYSCARTWPASQTLFPVTQMPHYSAAPCYHPPPPTTASASASKLLSILSMDLNVANCSFRSRSGLLSQQFAPSKTAYCTLHKIYNIYTG